MSREISAPRAWDDVAKKMLYSKPEQFDDSLSFRFDAHFETESPVYMWPTGLKDRNGRELFDGDRFKRGENVGTVKYIDDGFKIIWDEPNKEFFNDILRNHAGWGEVIGNIYEGEAVKA